MNPFSFLYISSSSLLWSPLCQKSHTTPTYLQTVEPQGMNVSVLRMEFREAEWQAQHHKVINDRAAKSNLCLSDFKTHIVFISLHFVLNTGRSIYSARLTMPLAKPQPTSRPFLLPSHLLTEKFTWSHKWGKLLPLLLMLLLPLVVAAPTLEELSVYLTLC